MVKAKYEQAMRRESKQSFIRLMDVKKEKARESII